MSSTLFAPPATTDPIDAIAFKLVRQVLDAQRTIARCEALCRELLLAVAASAPPGSARHVLCGSPTSPAELPSAPPPAPPQPGGPRRAEAVDGSERAAVKSSRNLSERTRRLQTTRQAAPRRHVQLDLEAANDELDGLRRRAM